MNKKIISLRVHIQNSRTNRLNIPTEILWGGNQGRILLDNQAFLKEEEALAENKHLEVTIDGKKYLEFGKADTITLKRAITIKPELLQDIIPLLKKGIISCENMFFTGKSLSDYNFGELAERAIAESQSVGVATTFSNFLDEFGEFSSYREQNDIVVTYTMRVPAENIFTHDNIPEQYINNPILNDYGIFIPDGESEIAFIGQVPEKYFISAEININNKQYTIDEAAQLFNNSKPSFLKILKELGKRLETEIGFYNPLFSFALNSYRDPANIDAHYRNIPVEIPEESVLIMKEILENVLQTSYQ